MDKTPQQIYHILTPDCKKAEYIYTHKHTDLIGQDDILNSFYTTLFNSQ